MTDRALIARLNADIADLAETIKRAERAQAEYPDTTARGRATRLAYLARRRDSLNRLYAELSDAWDVSYAALGARP